MIEDRKRTEENDTRDTNKSHRPPGVEIVIGEALEVEPHDQPEEEAK